MGVFYDSLSFINIKESIQSILHSKELPPSLKLEGVAGIRDELRAIMKEVERVREELMELKMNHLEVHT